MFRIKNKRTRSLRARLRAGCLDIYIYILLYHHRLFLGWFLETYDTFMLK